ncbi:MAG: DUF2088 domain-containing protein [Myxococcales bacterium]|nr:DUF2088 domain-containing protein [Myxococcales bacterium]
MKLDLAYGARPREVDLPDGARVLEAPASRGTLDYRPAIDRAWAEPFDQPPIDSLVGATDRLAVVVSDETRWLPRREALQSILDRIPTLRKRPVLLVANGKHPARDPGALGIGEDLLARFDVVNHDARDLGGLVAVGTTSTGLRVVVNRALVEADYRIAVGVVRPHYFMGYGGGAKSFVPGVAGIETTAANHRGRVDPSCRLGNLDGNRTRLEIEEAAALAGPATALHLVLNDRRELVRAVAGSLVDAHRVAAEACRAICEAPASPADVVVVSDPLPVTLNLYQALKLLAVAAPLVRSGGVVIVAAECPGGTGPLVAINDLIYKPWLSTLLPPGHRCVLVSDLKPDDVAETFFQSAPSVEAALARAWEHWGRRGSVLAIPRAGLIVPIVRDETEIQAGRPA